MALVLKLLHDQRHCLQGQYSRDSEAAARVVTAATPSYDHRYSCSICSNTYLIRVAHSLAVHMQNDVTDGRTERAETLRLDGGDVHLEDTVGIRQMGYCRYAVCGIR